MVSSLLAPGSTKSSWGEASAEQDLGVQLSAGPRMESQVQFPARGTGTEALCSVR